ncbi:MAG: hypothetical protein K2Z81_27175, partial [Cyanobacteria bacterium]|nr:hypothetical protein [Cyanobacteriota bacterium]
ETYRNVNGFEREILSSETLSPQARIRLLENVRKFEANTAYSAEQKAEVYKHSRSLLAPKDDAPMTREERANYVDQLFWHIANLKRNDQGSNNSCNVTTLRGLSLARHPERVARLAASVANTGEVKTTDGSTIRPPLESIRPRPGSPETVFPPGDGKRTALGKLWDVAALNTCHQRNTTDELGYALSNGKPPGYMEVAPTSRSDTGNRLVRTEADGSLSFLVKNKNGRLEPVDGPRMWASRVADTYYQLTGEKLGGQYLVHNSRGVGDAQKWKTLDGVTIENKAQLEARLKKGPFPMVIQGDSAILEHRARQQLAIDAGRDPAKVEKPSGGEHLWLVTGYDAATQTVSVDNSWYQASDMLSSAEVQAASKDPKKFVRFTLNDLFETMTANGSGGGESYTLQYQKFK